jgi:hypothetical protein
VTFRTAVRIFLIVTIGLAIASIVNPHQTRTAVAATQYSNHAALVIDTGSSTRTMCVGFNEASISGVQLLDRAAGVDPVIRSYSGQGAAICSLCHVGCPADASCLTCGGANYWSYFRSPAGTSSFRYSGVGAGSTQIHNGDVDGWKWGSGSAPQYQNFSRVCAADLATTSNPSTQPTVAGIQISRGAKSRNQALSQTPKTFPPLSTTTSAPDSPTTSTTSAVSSTTTTPNPKNASKKITASDWISWVLLIVAGILIAFTYIRTRKRIKNDSERDMPDKPSSSE